MADLTENILGMASQTAQKQGQGIPEGVHAGAELAIKQQQLTQQRQQMQMRMQQLQMAQYAKAVKYVKDLDSVKDPKFKSAMAAAGPGYFQALGVQFDPAIEKAVLNSQQGAAQFVALGQAVASGKLDFGTALKLTRDPHGWMGLPQDQQMQTKHAIEEAGGDPAFFDHALSSEDQQTAARQVQASQKEKRDSDAKAQHSQALQSMAQTRQEQFALTQHKTAIEGMTKDKYITQQLTTMQNLQAAVQNFEKGGRNPQEFAELQQAVRSNLGIKGSGGVDERSKTYLEGLGIDAGKIQQFITMKQSDVGKIAPELVAPVLKLASMDIANKQRFAGQQLNRAADQYSAVYNNPAAQKYKPGFDNTVNAMRGQFGIDEKGNPVAPPELPKPKADAAMVKKYLEGANGDPNEHAARFNSLSNSYDLSDIDLDEAAQPSGGEQDSDEEAAGGE